MPHLLDLKPAMNRLTALLLSVALLACGQPSHAELKLDSGMKSKQVEKLVAPLFISIVKPYGDQHSADFGWPSRTMGTFSHDDDKFSWLFNERRFFSMVGSFTPEIAQLENCKPSSDELNPGDRCDWRVKRFKVCHLFMFSNPSLKLETVVRLNIIRDKDKLAGLPRCLTVQAMAVAKTIPDAMLVTLGYIDSAEPANKNSDPTELSTTLLLRFKDDNGKLKIEQDDSCLGNPNNHKTIAAARKALSACSSAR